MNRQNKFETKTTLDEILVEALIYYIGHTVDKINGCYQYNDHVNFLADKRKIEIAMSKLEELMKK